MESKINRLMSESKLLELLVVSAIIGLKGGRQRVRKTLTAYLTDIRRSQSVMIPR